MNYKVRMGKKASNLCMVEGTKELEWHKGRAIKEDGKIYGTGCRKDYFFKKNLKNIVMAF